MSYVVRSSRTRSRVDGAAGPRGADERPEKDRGTWDGSGILVLVVALLGLLVLALVLLGEARSDDRDTDAPRRSGRTSSTL